MPLVAFIYLKFLHKFLNFLGLNFIFILGSRLLSDSVMRMLKIKFMVGLAGLEPATPSLSGTYSNQLSYRPIKLVKITKVIR